MPLRRQPFSRSSTPNPMRLTERDLDILETIHSFDGMISLKQIDRLFFSGKGKSQPRARMRLLYDHGFVKMPDESSIHKIPLGETIYWLDKKGAEIVAARYGQPLQRFPWRSNPRWSWLEHDLALNDFRICVLQASAKAPNLALNDWVPETSFLANPDKVEFRQKSGKRCKRFIRPDGFFKLQLSRQNSTHPDTFAFLVEIDMASHSNPRFAREKVLAGMAYLKSDAYRDRFGVRFGRWLVITKSQLRLQHLKQTTEKVGGNGLFYLSTFEAINPKTIFKQSVWHLAGRGQPTSIIPNLGC